MLNQFLLEQLATGNDVVLLIDEAQDLDNELLEQIRLLSNLETDQRKLLQIVLVGQPELRDKLNSPELRQLKQRIGLRCHISPLSPEEARLYIRHRLRIAGATDAGIFTDAAVQRIVEYSEGIPRVINIICDHCLLSGFADSKRRIDTGVVREAVEYLEEGERPKWRRNRDTRLVPTRAAVWAARAGVAALVLLLMLLLVFAANATGLFGRALS
jgi:general secretion pathway protein A